MKDVSKFLYAITAFSRFLKDKDNEKALIVVFLLERLFAEVVVWF